LRHGRVLDIPICGKCREVVGVDAELRGDDHLCAACVEAMPRAGQFEIEMQDARRRIYKATQRASLSGTDIEAVRRLLFIEFGGLEEGFREFAEKMVVLR
jgi:hypothetical protein